MSTTLPSSRGDIEHVLIAWYIVTWRFLAYSLASSIIVNGLTTPSAFSAVARSSTKLLASDDVEAILLGVDRCMCQQLEVERMTQVARINSRRLLSVTACDVYTSTRESMLEWKADADIASRLCMVPLPDCVVFARE